MVCALLFATLAQAEEIGGVVLDADNKPLASVAVEARIGVARYALSPHYDNWLFVGQPMKGQTDAKGRFNFQNLPADAVLTVFVKTQKGTGFAQGSKDLKVQLAPFGVLKGKIAGKRQQLKGARIWINSCFGMSGFEVKPDPKSGRFEHEEVPVGPARLYFKNHNFDFAIRDVEVKPGKNKPVKTAKFTEKYITRGDPLVEVTKVKLVDPDGLPLTGVQMWWSSRFMDGGMNSDREGVIKLAGGGVAIGAPPYILILRSLNREKVPLLGTYKKVKKGTALVEVTELRKVTGTLKVGGEPLEHYRIAAVGPPDKRVFHANVESGTFTIHLPEGKSRLVIGTVDGKLREKQVEVKAVNQPVEIELPK